MKSAIKIFENLRSFQADAGLSDGEKSLAYLRQRNYILERNIMLFCSYLLKLLKDEDLGNKQADYQRNCNSSVKSSTKRSHSSKAGYKVGIIGCGRIGKMLAKTFLKYNRVDPADLIVSTRRPQCLPDFRKHGITCVFDNEKVAKESDIVFLCCLPSQFQNIAQEMKGHLRGLTVSIIAGLPAKKISCAVHSQNILRLDFTQNLLRPSEIVDIVIEDDVVSSLANPSLGISGVASEERKIEGGQAYYSFMDLFHLTLTNTFLTKGFSVENSWRKAEQMLYGCNELLVSDDDLSRISSLLQIKADTSAYILDLPRFQGGASERQKLYSYLTPEFRMRFWPPFFSHFVGAECSTVMRCRRKHP